MRLVVTRDDYFGAALSLLAERGHAELKIGLLCRTLGVTTGSFYHYFGNWDAFVVELLDHWEREKTQRLAAAVAAEPDAIARVRTIKKMALELPHDAETAIRAWGHVNATVAGVQRRVDEERLAALRAVIVRIVGRNRRSERLAVMGVTLLVGWQQWRGSDGSDGRAEDGADVRELGRLLDDYEEMIMSHAGLAVR